MFIDKPHPNYIKYQKDWKRCRDAKEGQSAIHSAGEVYLSKLSGQNNDEYKAMRDRALFFGATGRTIDGLSGMLFRKPIQIEGSMDQDILDDIDLMDNDLQSFSEKIADEVLTVGRVGMLIDFPLISSDGLSLAAARQQNARPFIKTYYAEEIINWHYTRINNKKVLSHVFLLESIQEQINDYEFKEIEQIRVLMLKDSGYIQQILRKNAKHEWVLHDELEPRARGEALDFIPFVFVGAMGTQSQITKPPLMDLVNVNISHYKTTADLEHGAHFTALPTAVITGFNNEEEQDFKIGSSSAWVFSNPETQAFFLEFQGKGLETLQELLRAKENMMAALGAQMLTPDTRRNESTETSMLRHGGEHATLASVSISVSNALNKAISYIAMWIGSDPIVVDLNRDFMPGRIDPQMMQQLFLALQGGRISYETYFENLKSGEIIRGDKTADDELSEIQSGNTVIDFGGE